VKTGSIGQAVAFGNCGVSVQNGCCLLITDCDSAEPVGDYSGCDTDIGTPTSSTLLTLGIVANFTYLGGTPSGTNVTVTLSDEYTTTELANTTDTATYAASWSSYGSCSGETAFYALTTDEITATMQNVGYKFTFNLATTVSGCKLEFDILYDDNTLFSHESITLGAFVSEYEYELVHPGDANTAIKLANWEIVTPSIC
jgi:hypothetical protein